MKKVILSTLVLVLGFSSQAQKHSDLSRKGAASVLSRFSEQAIAYAKTAIDQETESNFKLRDSTLQYTWNTVALRWDLSGKVNYIRDKATHSVTALFYNWDTATLVWEPSGKAVLQYSEIDNKLSHTSSYWDETIGSWITSWRNETIKDQQGHITLEINSYWDLGTNAWVFNDKHLQNFDVMGNKTNEVYYTWDKSQDAWRAFSKIDFEYDDQGLKIAETNFEWNGSSQSWLGTLKYTLSLEDAEERYFKWNSAAQTWQITAKNTLILSGRQIKEKTGWLYDAQTATFSKSEKVKYSYNYKGDETENIDYQWDLSKNQWIELSKQTTLYDPTGKKIQVFNYFWTKSGMTWLPSFKEEKSYDKYGYTNMNAFYYWSNNIIDWNATTKTTYQNDNQGNILEKEDYVTDPSTLSYVPSWKEVNYYKEEVVTALQTDMNKARTFEVFPNPAIDQIHIANTTTDFTTVSILNALGEQVLYNSQANEALSIEHLKSGVYIAVINTKDQIYKRAFIKE